MPQTNLTGWYANLKLGSYFFSNCESIKENIHSFRRQLQTLHIKYLKDIYIDDQNKFPHDSKSLAILHLGILSEKIDIIIKENKKSLDDYTLAHLLKSLDTIEQVLDSE